MGCLHHDPGVRWPAEKLRVVAIPPNRFRITADLQVLNIDMCGCLQVCPAVWDEQEQGSANAPPYPTIVCPVRRRTWYGAGPLTSAETGTIGGRQELPKRRDLLSIMIWGGAGSWTAFGTDMTQSIKSE